MSFFQHYFSIPFHFGFVSFRFVFGFVGRLRAPGFVRAARGATSEPTGWLAGLPVGLAASRSGSQQTSQQTSLQTSRLVNNERQLTTAPPSPGAPDIEREDCRRPAGRLHNTRARPAHNSHLAHLSPSAGLFVRSSGRLFATCARVARETRLYRASQLARTKATCRPAGWVALN